MLDSSDELIAAPTVTVPPSSPFVVLPQSHHPGASSPGLLSSTKLSQLSSLSTPTQIAGSTKFIPHSVHSTSSPLPSHLSQPTSVNTQLQQQRSNVPVLAQLASVATSPWKPKHDLHRQPTARPTMTVAPMSNSDTHSSEPSALRSIADDGHALYAPNGVSQATPVDRVIDFKPSNVSSASSSSSPSSITISATRPHKNFLGRTTDKSTTFVALNGLSRRTPNSRLGLVLRLAKLLRLPQSNRLLFFWFVIICLISITAVISRFSTSSLPTFLTSPSRAISVGGYVAWFTAKRHARRLLHDYQRLLHIYPLASRAISAGIVFFCADSIAQFLNRPKHRPFSSTYSFGRNFRYGMYGLVLLGPLLYAWYGLMHRYGPPDTLRGSIEKALIESFTLEPVCIIIYICYDGIVYQRPLSYVKRTLRTRLFPTWVNQCVFWFPANFSNYYIGTPDMRVIFSNLCSLLWNIYFSAKASRWSAPNQGQDQVLPSVTTKPSV